MKFLFMVLFMLYTGTVEARELTEQDKIILLNDSAVAVADDYPDLSRALTKLADDREKVWEYDNTHKNAAAAVTAKDIPGLQDEIKVLRSTAPLLKPLYPLIARNLGTMADDIEKSIIELQKPAGGHK